MLNASQYLILFPNKRKWFPTSALRRIQEHGMDKDDKQNNERKKKKKLRLSLITQMEKVAFANYNYLSSDLINMC